MTSLMSQFVTSATRLVLDEYGKALKQGTSFILSQNQVC